MKVWVRVRRGWGREENVAWAMYYWMVFVSVWGFEEREKGGRGRGGGGCTSMKSARSSASLVSGRREGLS